MKLYFHKDPLGNFGDDLNPWLFERLLPGVFDGHCYHDPMLRQATGEDNSLFVGIGTLLNNKIPGRPIKAVFGSGAGYGPASKVDQSWNIYCVRGPRTAELLGLPPEKAVTDAAALCRRIDLPEAGQGAHFAFMPHCSTARYGLWDLICADLNIRYIDPQGTVDDVFSALRSTEILITEAMHGAILADTLRVPWVPVSTTSGILSLKWQDWCASLNMTYTAWRLPSLWKLKGLTGLTKATISRVKSHLARRALRTVIAKARPQLSNERLLEDRIDQLEARLDLFRSDFARGRYAECTADI